MAKRVMFGCMVSMALVLGLGQAHAAARDLGADLHGQPIRQLGGPGVRAVVLFFAASDCPVSNRYVPEIARLTQEFGAQGVRFWWVYPNADDTAQVVAGHNRDYSITGDTILDPRQSLVKLGAGNRHARGSGFPRGGQRAARGVPRPHRRPLYLSRPGAPPGAAP